jgi:hypothetical protein
VSVILLLSQQNLKGYKASNSCGEKQAPLKNGITNFIIPLKTIGTAFSGNYSVL